MTITRLNYFDFDAISASMLKEPTPFHYYEKYVSKSFHDDETEALRKGSGLHCMVFEPDEFAARFPIFDGDKRSNEAKSRYASMEADAIANGGSVLREADVVDIRGMAASLRRDKRAMTLLDRMSHPEYPIAYTDPETGILCKCKLDSLACDRKVLIELKSGRDVSDSAMSKEIYNRSYHLAAAHYSIGVDVHFGEPIEPGGFVFMMVENRAPYAVNVRVLDEESIEAGRVLRGERLARLAECRAKNEWPSYGTTIESIGIPHWAK